MEELISEHLATWTEAQIVKAAGGRGRKSSGEGDRYGIKKLRELILELAVRGKLVAQDPADEPASLLLERIAAEKASLITAGKIKKQKVLPGITEDANPFDLPDRWEWVKLGDVIEFVNGYAFKSRDFIDTGVGVVKIGDIQNGEISTDKMARVDREVVSNLDESLRVECNDLLIAMSGATTGKLGFNKSDEVFYINQRVGKILPYSLSIQFLYYPLTTKIAENLAKSIGSAIPNLSTVQIKNIVFALPPLSEQHRIVAKVDELMALCDRLEKQQDDSAATQQALLTTLLDALVKSADHAEFAATWQRIAEHFDLLFTTEQSIDQIKQTILQLAVMGKLVPQNPDDEPASVLLKKIAAEKARLVKEGKIKKQKKLPEIEEEEKPFALPEGWAWARLQEIIDVRDGTHDSPKDAVGTDTYPLVTSKNFYKGKINFDEARRISAEDHFNISKRSYVERYDILFSMIGGNLGNQVMVSDDRPFSVKNVALFKYYDKGLTSPFYIKKNLEHLAINLQSKAAGGAQPFVSLTFLRKVVIAVPPKVEQHRIVTKVDELMTLCDTLKTRLQQAQTTQVQLADALVEQAVA